MSNLYIFNYNSFYNRIVKRETTLAGYGTPEYSLINTNFKDGNDLQTTHIVNYYGSGNYVVITDSSFNIKSRWFIENKDTKRGEQNLLNLRRDVLADFYNDVIESPIILERAWVKKENPLIFNPEGFSFNQIKKNEILLKDSLGIPFLILYMAKNAPSKTITLASNTYTADIVLNTSIENSIYAQGTYYSSFFDTTYKMEYYDTHTSKPYYVKFDKNITYGGQVGWSSSGTLRIDKYYQYIVNEIGSTWVSNYTNYDSLLTNNVAHTVINSQTIALLQRASSNGLIIKDINNKYYRVQTIVNQKSETGYIPTSYTLFQSLYSVITNAYSSEIETAANGETFSYETNVYEINVILTDVSTTYGNNITLDPSAKYETSDSECNIIAIPYGDIAINTSYYLEDDDTPIFTQNAITKDAQMALAIQFAQEYGSSVVYDMQMLPYNPVPFLLYENRLDVSGYTGNSKSYTYFSFGNGYAGVIFHLTTKQLSFNINQALNIPEDSSLLDEINIKLANECDIYRLCSPNYNGVFEFSVAKNNGVDYFNVDITLKPYNPYIHINPNFKGIYGSDYDDSRGLICGGDFSLPIIGDQFVNYELQNKNYQLAFNRQIEHMDFEYSLQKQEAVFGAAIGAVGGASSGAVAGSAAGPYGAAIGAIVGGASSLLGGALDYAYMSSRMSENKSLAIDNFKYQLGNIRALPYSLSKVNPFTYNNKIYPFIEYYSCTDEEKAILIEKIRYNSMNLNAIGEIRDYLQSDKTFVKGQLIRYNNSEGIANNLIEAIAYELMKGVYI